VLNLLLLPRCCAQVKAAREARNSAGSRSQAANMAAEATAAAAETSSAENNTRRNVPRRNSSLRRMPAGSASTHAGAAAAAATASGNHLTTPSTSGERQQQQQQHLTSSTYLATDSSSQPLGLSGSEQIVSSSEAVAVARAADGAGPSSRGTAGLTAWLQIVPSQQQQQQQHGGAAGAAPAVSADCASTMHPDIRSRDGQLGTSGSGSGGSGASAARAQQNLLAHCNSTGGLSADASRQPPEAAGKSSPYHQQTPADKQQQQHAGNLRRHLLSGWRNRPPRGSTDNSSVLDSPTAAAVAAPAGTANGSHNGHSSEHNSGQHSGASAAAAAAAAAAAGAVVSSGGTVAIMHAPEADGSNGNRGSCGSQPSWAGTGGSSARRLEDEEGRKEQAEQQVRVQTGGRFGCKHDTRPRGPYRDHLESACWAMCVFVCWG
jgi:hypothetical protein